MRRRIADLTIWITLLGLGGLWITLVPAGAPKSTFFKLSVIALVLTAFITMRHRIPRLRPGGLRERRVRLGRCPSCGYDLRHDHEGGCPECGWRRALTPAESASPATDACSGDSGDR